MRPYWSIVFFVIVVVAGVFGFGFAATPAVEVARALFFVFLVLFAISVVTGASGRTRRS